MAADGGGGGASPGEVVQEGPGEDLGEDLGDDLGEDLLGAAGGPGDVATGGGVEGEVSEDGEDGEDGEEEPVGGTAEKGYALGAPAPGADELEAWERGDGWAGSVDEVEEGEEDNDLVMLRRLVRDYGVRTVAARTGLGVEVLRECHVGARDLGAEMIERLLVFDHERPDRGEEEDAGDGMWSRDQVNGDREYVLAVDLDGDGKPDFEVPGIHQVARGENWSERTERRRRSLWSARSLAMMTQFRLGMSEEERVAAVGFVTQVELVLILGFGETMGDPDAHWDAEKRSMEIDRRLARLRWVEEKQREVYGGWKGVWRALVGRKKVSGKDLYEKMLDEADGMMTAMSGVGQSDEVMEELMKLSGVGYLRDAPDQYAPAAGA